MCIVLEFPKHTTKKAGSFEKDRTGTAEILFFEGVRYSSLNAQEAANSKDQDKAAATAGLISE